MEPAAQPNQPAAVIQSKHDVLFESLKKFYRDQDKLRVLTDVLRHNAHAVHAGENDSAAVSHHHISLRILDWLVTNYAKKHNIVYLVPGEDGIQSTFNMFLEYKSQLKAYSKKYFDPFCRRDRLEFADADGQTLHTTVGQLNFFRWAIVHGVIRYGALHNHVIEHDMLNSIKHRGQQQQQQAASTAKSANKPKRRELSKAAIKGCTKTHVTVTVRFK